MKIAIILIISLSMAFTQTINEQIKSLETLSPKERVNLMNHIKEQLIEMNRNERMKTIEKLRAKMNPQSEKDIKVANYQEYHDKVHAEQGESNEGDDTTIDSTMNQREHHPLNSMNMEAEHSRDSMHERFSRELIEHRRETSHEGFEPPQNQGAERQPSRNNSAEEFQPPENQAGERESSRNSHNTMNER